MILLVEQQSSSEVGFESGVSDHEGRGSHACGMQGASSGQPCSGVLLGLRKTVMKDDLFFHEQIIKKGFQFSSSRTVAEPRVIPPPAPGTIF